MVTRMLGVAALVAAVGVSSAAALNSRTTGVLTGVSGSSLQITTKGRESVTFKVDEKTAYQKWTTHQPWQSSGLGTRAMATGRCVSVEQRPDSSGVAGVVWVNEDSAGTIWDPCKSLR